MRLNKYWTLSPKNAGFTLIELLVVIVIVGILGSIAAPGWLAYLNRQRVSSVRTELRSVLEQARTNAQQRSASYSVVLGSTADGPTAAISTGGNTFPPVALSSNSKNIQMEEFVGTETPPSHLEFNYKGEVKSELIPFVIKIKSNQNASTQKCLIVSSLLGGITDAEGATCDSPDLGT